MSVDENFSKIYSLRADAQRAEVSDDLAREALVRVAQARQRFVTRGCGHIDTEDLDFMKIVPCPEEEPKRCDRLYVRTIIENALSSKTD